MRPTSPLWYLAALLVALAAWVLAVVVAAGDWDPMRSAEVTPVSTRTPEDAGPGRLALYTDTRQPERTLTCTIRRGRGERVPLQDPGVELTTTQDAVQWHLVAVSEPGLDRNDLKARCTMTDEALDTAGYAWALVPDPDRARTGQGIGLLGSVAAAGLAGWVLVSRRRAAAQARVAT